MNRRPLIVVVEDDDQFRAVLLKRLQSLNYDVISAENGLLGWEVIKSSFPDLIISDLMMPGLDGQQLCKQVKADPRFEHIYFIMLTARDSIDDRVAGLEIGADDYISKPVNNKELVARVKAGLRISSLYNQVKASEKRLRSLIENASDAIIQFNTDGKIIEANEKACQIFCYSKNQLLSLYFEDLLANTDREKAREKFASMQRIGNFIEEILMQRADGALIPVESANSTIDTDSGRVCQCILRDLTKRKEIEQQLIQVEKLRALGGMVGGIAHDFNNLLAAILGYTELALRDSKDENTVRRLKIIEKAARDGAEIVRLLQEFTRVRSDARQESLNINKLVEQVLLLTRHKWKDEVQAKGISIKIETNFGLLPPVQGILAELREALTNIIFNAVDSISHSGVLSIRTWHDSSHIYISVADNGIGMSEDVKKRIFDPFFTTKGPTRSGLGLSVCYGIISRHKGSIQVESEAGQGSKFTILLPINQEDIPSYTQHQTDDSSNYSVLLIDDEEIVRGAIEEILVDEGYKVVSANTGEEGIDRFLAQKFDIVITDLGMPGMPGWDVIKRLKDISPKTPVILLTGWANQTDVTRAKECGVDTIIGKPISSSDLISTVKQALQTRTK